MKVSAQCTVGDWSIDTASDPHTELNSISIKSARGAVDQIKIALYLKSPPSAGLLEQAIGAATDAIGGAIGLGGGGEPAFTTEVRGSEIKDGDAISAKLTAGEVSTIAFSGEVLSTDTGLGLTTINGASGAHRLATTRVNQVFENQAADRVIADLAGQAGATVGKVSASISYPYLVIDETRSVFDHIKALAMREGMECYFNADNELTVESFSKTSPDHEFHYAIHILALETFISKPNTAHTRVYTESPASTQGQKTWHWLTKDSSAFQSEAGSGASLLAMSDGAIRTKDAADQLSVNKHGAIKDLSTRGRLKLLGNPAVRVADAIEVLGMAKPELNGLFKVTAVEHRFSKHEGYVTWVEFSGQGGADAVGGLLGALGDLAGAVGF